VTPENKTLHDDHYEEVSLGTSLAAVVNVAFANAANTILHPVHAAKVLVGIEREKPIPEMIRDEEKRLVGKRRSREPSHS
jgi:hypothetical protein